MGKLQISLQKDTSINRNNFKNSSSI